MQVLNYTIMENITIEKRQMSGYDAFMTVTVNETEYEFFYNMRGWRARFALKNEERNCYYHFKETTEKNSIKSLKDALKTGFPQLTNY